MGINGRLIAFAGLLAPVIILFLFCILLLVRMVWIYNIEDGGFSYAGFSQEHVLPGFQLLSNVADIVYSYLGIVGLLNIFLVCIWSLRLINNFLSFILTQKDKRSKSPSFNILNLALYGLLIVVSLVFVEQIPLVAWLPQGNGGILSQMILLNLSSFLPTYSLLGLSFLALIAIICAIDWKLSRTILASIGFGARLPFRLVHQAILGKKRYEGKNFKSNPASSNSSTKKTTTETFIEKSKAKPDRKSSLRKARAVSTHDVDDIENSQATKNTSNQANDSEKIDNELSDNKPAKKALRKEKKKDLEQQEEPSIVEDHKIKKEKSRKLSAPEATTIDEDQVPASSKVQINSDKPNASKQLQKPNLNVANDKTLNETTSNPEVVSLPDKRLSSLWKSHSEQETKAALRNTPESLKKIRRDLQKLVATEVSPTTEYSEEEKQQNAAYLEQVLAEYNFKMTFEEVVSGPVVSRYEFTPPPGFKVAQISAVTKDLARTMAVDRVRIEESIPGKSTIGLEVPNTIRRNVNFSEIVGSKLWKDKQESLEAPVILGQQIDGVPMVLDLVTTPHLLVAGTTGSGKSVGVNAMLVSLLMTYTPLELRLILVDPKILEFAGYKKLPHLLTDVVTEMEDAGRVIEWCVKEMDNRYQMLADAGVRNIKQYNENTDNIHLPYIFIFIDEWADLIMTSGKAVESSAVRIAQKARAAGIHLVLATQRPSVDVITGILKSNIPTRWCFQVASQVDSRTMLDENGAEQLLGKGDSILKAISNSQRVHGAFVQDDAIDDVVNYWWKNEKKYKSIPRIPEADMAPLANQGESSSDSNGADDIYLQAIEVARESEKVSISKIQRKLSIGFNKAANLVERMEEEGIISGPDSRGLRRFIDG